jgi:hypothetical protein
MKRVRIEVAMRRGKENGGGSQGEDERKNWWGEGFYSEPQRVPTVATPSLGAAASLALAALASVCA